MRPALQSLGDGSQPATISRAAGLLAALRNERFRGWLLLAVAVPTIALYSWRALVESLTGSGMLEDFTRSYLVAAARLSGGQDPYEPATVAASIIPSGPFYVQPPLMAWLLQPLVPLDPHVSALIVVVALNASTAVFVVLLWRALKIRDWQLRLLTCVVALSFEPTLSNVFEGQINPILLALSGVWLLAYCAGDRWWGGAVIGLSIVLKLMHAPCALLMAFAYRWRMLAAAALAALLALLIAAPQLLPEYLTRILPLQLGGTGFFENHSPNGTITRLLVPGSVLAGRAAGTSPWIQPLSAAVALAVIAISAWRLGGPGAGLRRRSLEASLAVAVGPLIASYSWGTHMILLLLPLLVVLVWSIRREDWAGMALCALAWLLLSPLQTLTDVVVQGGVQNLWLLRPLAEHGVAGVGVIWLSALRAVGRAAEDQVLQPARPAPLKGDVLSSRSLAKNDHASGKLDS